MPSFTKIVKYFFDIVMPLALAYDSLSTKKNTKTNEETIESPEEPLETSSEDSSEQLYDLLAGKNVEDKKEISYIRKTFKNFCLSIKAINSIVWYTGSTIFIVASFLINEIFFPVLTFTNRLAISAYEYTVIAVNVIRMLPGMISFLFQILCDIVMEYAFLILLLAFMITCVRLGKKNTATSHESTESPRSAFKLSSILKGK
jgi:hypothetical protein